jgi:hypothetical protein
MTFEKESLKILMSDVIRRIFVMTTKTSMRGGPSLGLICHQSDEALYNRRNAYVVHYVLTMS